MYIKIDNKIVLKIYDLKIKNVKNYSKQALNLHKTIFTAVKFLKIFQIISIHNISYGKFKIQKITLKNKKLDFVSGFMSFKSVINPAFKNSFINFEYLKIPKYALIKNLVLNLNFNKNCINAAGFGYLNKKKFALNAKLDTKNILRISLYADSIPYQYQNIKTVTENLSAFFVINLNYYNYKANINAANATVRYKNKIFRLGTVHLNSNSKSVKISLNSLYTPVFKPLKNIYLKNIYFYYDPPNSFGDFSCRQLYVNYKQYNVAINGIKGIFSNKNDFITHIKNILLKTQRYSFKLNKIFIKNSHGQIRYTAKNSKLTSKNIELNSSEIIGNLIKIALKKINGKIYGFNTSVSDIKADIKNKTAHIQSIDCNNVKIKNISYQKRKITFNSKTLFTDNLKQIINRFIKTQIPFTQISGYNTVTGSVFLQPDKISPDINITTKLSAFNIFNYRYIVSKAFVNVNDKNITFNILNSKLYLMNPLKIGFKGKGLLSYKKYSLILKGLINFKLNGLINLHNYREKINIDFKTKTIKTKNSSLYINFKTKRLIVSNLKNLLKFTSLKRFIQNGIILINFNRYTNILSFIKIKLPVLYAHSNTILKTPPKHSIKKLFFNIFLLKNNISVINKYLNIVILDKNISAVLKGLDIDLKPLEKIFLNNNKNNSFNYSINLKTNNANIIYGTHKFLSQKAHIVYKNNNIKFSSEYKNSKIDGYTKGQYFLLEGKNFSKEEFDAFLPKFNFFSSINLDFVMVKSPENFYTGKIYINHGIVKKLKTLNNIIAFINTIPSLLSLSSPGFTSKGYKISKGYVNYLYYKNILYIKQAKILGTNLDFFAKGYVDFNKNYIFLKITANMKMKIKKIPIIGKGLSYLLFGKDGGIDIKMIVKGNLNNPKVEKDIGKEILISPFKLFKRAITLPFHLF